VLSFYAKKKENLHQMVGKEGIKKMKQQIQLGFFFLSVFPSFSFTIFIWKNFSQLNKKIK
jgi:hypothetical protein